MNAILIRHGHTPINGTGTYFSTRDPKLSEQGVLQARLLAEMLAGVHVDQVFSSPKSRARITAEILCKNNGLSPIIHAGLLEMDTGELEGLNPESLSQTMRDFLEQWRLHPATLVWPGGESLAQAGLRAANLIREQAVVRSSDANIVFVGHGLSLSAAICLLLGIDVNKFRIFRLDPASVTVVRLDAGVARLLCLNVGVSTSGTCKLPVL